MSTDHNHHKRPRTAAIDSDDIDMDSLDGQSPNKALRSSENLSSPLVCRLPPTCSHRPVQLQSAAEMEQHYSKYHAHVCMAPKCGCVFHEERLLELHQTECHDPIAAVRKDRGERIYACFQPDCDRFFRTPKGRRLHLIDAHGYHKDFFFAVTLHGIGGLLSQSGEGASLIRDEWKPDSDKSKGKKPSGAEGLETLKESTSHGTPKPKRDSPPAKSHDIEHPPKEPTKQVASAVQNDTDMNVDELADSMNALNLVPISIRFGRGGKRSFGGIGTAGGFVRGVHHDEEPPTRGGGGPKGRGNHVLHSTPERGEVLGRSARGTSRGRGRIVPP